MLNNIASMLGVASPAIGDYESIQTVTVGGTAQAAISFTSISSAYKHLQIRYIARGSTRERVDLTFNSDTGATQYSAHRLYGLWNGTTQTTTSEARIDRSAIWLLSASGVSTTASTFAVGVIDLLDYSNTTTYKTSRHLGGYDDNGAANEFITFESGFWKSTNAISSITMTVASGLFQQYSSFALYGIK